MVSSTGAAVREHPVQVLAGEGGGGWHRGQRQAGSQLGHVNPAVHVCQRCDVPIFERDGAVAVFAPSSRFLLVRPSSAVAVLARSSDVPFIRSASDVMTLVPSSDVAVPDRQFDPVQLGRCRHGR